MVLSAIKIVCPINEESVHIMLIFDTSIYMTMLWIRCVSNLIFFFSLKYCLFSKTRNKMINICNLEFHFVRINRSAHAQFYSLMQVL